MGSSSYPLCTKTRNIKHACETRGSYLRAWAFPVCKCAVCIQAEGPGGTPYIMAKTGRLRPKGVPFSGFSQVYKRVGIPLVD